MGLSPHAAVNLALHAQLRVVNDMGPADENVEESGNVFAVDAFDLRRYCLLEAGRDLRDRGVGRRGSIVLRHVEEDEIVVVRKSHHQLRGRQRTLVEESAHGFARRLEYTIELLPSVNFFDLGVPVEIEIENDDLSAILNRFADAVDGRSDGGQARQGVAQELMIIHAQRREAAADVPMDAFGARSFTFRSTVAAR